MPEQPSESPEPVVTRNFLVHLAKGGIKMIPVAGGLIEEMIFGTLDGEKAQAEAQKLQTALASIQNQNAAQNTDLGDILLHLDRQDAFTADIKASIDALVALLKGDADAPVPASVQQATGKLIRSILDKPLDASTDIPALVQQLAAKIPRVFISHSSKDKPFVRRLANDLSKQNLNVWIDERELQVGDSIVQGISDALRDTDYVIVVLSENSLQSKWVQQEVSSALMDQLANKQIAVLPVRIDDTALPPLLRDRVYADFRTDYDSGLQRLLSALKQETSLVSASLSTPVATGSQCIQKLEKLSKGDLRRRIDKRLDRNEVGVVWFDTFSDKMDDQIPTYPKPNCVIELIDRADRRGLLSNLLDYLCDDYPHVANP